MNKPLRPLPPLASLPASKLHALIARLAAESSAMTSRAIEGGLGHLRHSEIEALAAREPETPAGQLAVEYIARAERYSAARAELTRRQEWHGSDRPIRTGR